MPGPGARAATATSKAASKARKAWEGISQRGVNALGSGTNAARHRGNRRRYRKLGEGRVEEAGFPKRRRFEEIADGGGNIPAGPGAGAAG